MEIAEIKRWVWVVIGVLVGAGLAYAWTSAGTDGEGIRNVDQLVFERDLVLHDPKTNEPFIRHLIVHPVEDSFDGKVNVVTYQRRALDKAGNVGWLDRRMIAKIPYQPVIPNRVAPAADLTIEKYLTEVAGKNPAVSFHIGWWLQPRNAALLGAAGGMVLIGGIWPTLLGLMVGAGLAPKPEATKSAKSKRDWGSIFRRASKATKSAGPAAPSATEQQEVDDVADAYARGLQPTGSHGGADATDLPAVTESPVQTLSAGPLVVNPDAKPAEEDDVEVKGEYYPVLIHHKKDTGKKDEKS